MNYYADYILTREYTRTLDQYNVAHCDRWLRDLRLSALLDDTDTPEIVTHPRRQEVSL